MNRVESVDRVLKLATVPRAFKWNGMFFPRTSGQSCSSSSPAKAAAGAILIRYTVFPELSSKTVRIPLQLEKHLQRLRNYGETKCLIRQEFQMLPILGSCSNLDEFSTSLAKELFCRFQYRPEFFETGYRDRRHVLIIFLNLRVGTRMEMENLRSCPKVDPLNVKGIEGIEPAIKVLDKGKKNGGREEDLCPICLGELDEKEYYARTCCLHIFHHTCIAKWLIKGNSSCPCCRSSFYVQI